MRDGQSLAVKDGEECGGRGGFYPGAGGEIGVGAQKGAGGHPREITGLANPDFEFQQWGAKRAMQYNAQPNFHVVGFECDCKHEPGRTSVDAMYSTDQFLSATKMN